MLGVACLLGDCSKKVEGRVSILLQAFQAMHFLISKSLYDFKMWEPRYLYSLAHENAVRKSFNLDAVSSVEWLVLDFTFI